MNRNMPFPEHNSIPALTVAQMIEVDRAMIEDYHIDLIQMMENAGRNLAHLARERFLGGDPRGQKVVVLAGTGGNGGGTLVCARRLHNYGADVRVFITKPGVDFMTVPGHQLDILRRMNVPVALAEEVETADETAVLIIDGLIGYSLQGGPRGPAAALINWANRQAAPILALDTPSGLDTTTGAIYEPAIRAAATMTLALPKVGLLGETPALSEVEVAVTHVGELYLADIGVPPALYAAPALQLTVGAIFATSDIVRVR
ncbi:MAG: NAD(P)H-hydrate epimerase [Anaerolinea sp.]|nr:NAD(P)H-hydrate epimerase [Anaerolinea sp.]